MRRGGAAHATSFTPSGVYGKLVIMSWHRSPLLAFDLETTGPEPDTARVVTATAIRINPASGSKQVREWLVDPGVEIPAEASAIHGISTEHAREHGQQAATAIPEIARCLIRDGWQAEAPVIAYNAAYDLTVLDRELARHGFPSLAGEVHHVVDPLVIDREMDRYRKGKRTLTACARHYGVHIGEDEAHSSQADALAAARIAWCLAQHFHEIGTATLEALHTWQIRWHQDWADRFAQYLRERKRRDGAPAEEIDAVAIDGTWPLRQDA